MEFPPADLTWTAFAGACAVTALSGVVKGAVGFAMPLIMIAGMGLFIDPLLVVAGIIGPIVVSNTLQALRGGLREMQEAAVEHWRYILIVCVMIFAMAQFVTAIPTRLIFIVLGAPVVAFSVIQLVGWRPVVPPHRRRVAEWGIGALSGTLGGLAGTWGPPTVLYLLALDVPRARFIVVQGVVYGLGSYTLLAGHLRSGVLNAATLPLSLALVVPAVIGMAAGVWLSGRLDQERFRKVTLVVLVVAGLNLIRRGLAG